MLYRDLVDFEKIVDVIQLKQADNRKEAEDLVKTYVISDGMAEKLVKDIFPNLKPDNPNNKGLLILGNYGTGKSHLMSVISSVAEDKHFLQFLKSSSVKDGASEISGHFKVIREEIGSTRKNFRDFICDTLTRKLEDLNVNYSFPSYEKVNNHKDLFVEMMSCFEEKYPEKGLLLIVDELLDYLRSRKEQELILDLNFLRELGEISSITKFRFIGGIQEALFENPRFSFAANSLGRVKDRFLQIRIVREDIEYVISERLLKKTDDQKRIIEDHLGKFTICYENLHKDMKRFVSLFPVHPSFVETFERIYIAEKREILKTLTKEMEDLMNKTLPDDETGIISYDSYWKHIQNNPSIRSIPDIKEVLDKSNVLAKKIEFSKPLYRPVAKRIIQALSVHRLTTDDIYSKIGVTADELREELFIYLKTPEEGSEFLTDTINVVLNDILITVNRQFISKNQENGQYYLDLKKDIDFDALIEQKGQSLDDDKLDRYYYNILKILTEKSDSTYVSGFNIWEHELLWTAKKMTRKGYLFFCSPNNRSTTQPPRDFYIYFLGPNSNYKIKNCGEDEIYFNLKNTDDDFRTNLKYYASSMELYNDSSSGNKKVYQEKSDGYRRKLTKWLNEHVMSYSVTYNNETINVSDWLKRGYGNTSSFLEIVDSVCSICLNGYFDKKYSHYPAFAEKVTSSTIGQTGQEAINLLCGGLKTKQGRNVLNAFGFLDKTENIDMSNSIYAKYFIDLLEKKGKGQVINRKEIIDEKDSRIETDFYFKLEPEWIAVILTAMAHGGYIILATEKGKVDALELTGNKKQNIEDLKNFKYFQKPKELPVAELKALFKLLNLPEGAITIDIKDGIKKMVEKTNEILKETTVAMNKLNNGYHCWGVDLLDDVTVKKYMEKLKDFKEFLEKVLNYDTQPKLKNFPFSEKDINDRKKTMEILETLRELESIMNTTLALSSYLQMAAEKLHEKSKVKNLFDEEKKKFIQDISSGSKVDIQTKWLPVMKKLKEDYIDEYMKLHKLYRLDSNGDHRKSKILNGPLFKELRELSQIDMLDRKVFKEIQDRLIDNLKSCFNITVGNMEKDVICPHCKFNPTGPEVRTVCSLELDECENKLEELYDNWRENLHSNLTDPFVKNSIDLLSREDRKIIEGFINTKKLPQKVDSNFVRIVNEVLKGLEKVIFSFDEFKSNISCPVPCTLDDLNKEFEKFVQEKVKGKEKGRVRIVIN